MHRRILPFVALTAALACNAPAQGATFARSPFLQQPTETSAIVAFRTDASCAAQLVGTGPNGETKSANDTGGTQHALRLEGLTAGTAYSWHVEACGVTADGVLETAPPRGTQSVHFAAVGDSGTASSTQVAVGNRIIAANPEILLHVGDTAYDNGTAAEVQSKFFAPWASLFAQVPFYVALGNHEYNTDQARPTLDSLELPVNDRGSERYYSFDRGHVHFVALDSNCVRGYTATESSCKQADMLAWLEADLTANAQPWTVVFFHHPPWSSGDHASAPLVRDAFGPSLERHGVDLVLTGHDHDYERSHPMIGTRVAGAGERGIPYLVIGTGSAKLKAPSIAKQPEWSAVRRSDTYGYLDVQVDRGTLVARFIGTNGSTVDSLTLTKDVAAEEPAQPTPGGGNSDPQPDPGTGIVQPTPNPGTDPEAPGSPLPIGGGSGGCASAAVGAFGAAVAAGIGLRRRRRR